MTYATYKDPRLNDFLAVAHDLCPDEIEQYEAFTGTAYDPDHAAIMHCLKRPAWVVTFDEQPLVVGGFDEIRQGVWQDWMFSRPAAWSEDHWRHVTRVCKRHMDVMLQTVAHRLQCVSLASRTRAHRWYAAIGLQEGPRMPQYGAGRQDAIMFHRVRTL